MRPLACPEPGRAYNRATMLVEFHKMQGAGNDFVVLDERAAPLGLTASQLAWLADRRRGVGCDQIILIGPGDEAADAAIRFYNSDGSEAGACGNGTRCAASLLAAETGRRDVRLRGPAGPLAAEMLEDGRVRVDMGAARLDWRDIPLSGPADTLHLPLAGDPAACSMGNPHATFFVDDLDTTDIAARGAALEHDPLFPQACNIGFAQMLGPRRLRLFVWERGAGLTLACGTGACAAAVNAHRRGLAARQCLVEMPGGRLEVAWREDGHVLLAGPSVLDFAGRILVSDTAR